MSPDRFSPLNSPPRPLLIVLSGLSGGGKDTVLAGLRRANLPLAISVSATTRTPRPSEKDGADYYFISKEKFREMIKSRQLLEWAQVYGNYYGIPGAPVKKWLKEGKDVLVKIDVQGAATIKKKVPQAVFIFICTISLGELEKRLKKRRTESREELELRLKTAEKEMERLGMFDYIVINREGEVKKTIENVMAIIAAEKCRVNQREIRV